jgi:hypothetical protein
MKINEIITLTSEELVESLSKNNDTGCNPEDLAKIVEAHRKDEWSEEIDGDQFIKMIEEEKMPWQK